VPGYQGGASRRDGPSLFLFEGFGPKQIDNFFVRLWDKVRSDPAVIVRTVLAGYQDAIDHRVTAINPADAHRCAANIAWMSYLKGRSCLTEQGGSLNDLRPRGLAGGRRVHDSPGTWHAHHNESGAPAHLIPVQDAGLQTYLRSLGIRFTARR
jgi:hypothetical protein